MSGPGDWPLWHAGEVLPGDARVVSAADPGFLFGEGLFTTLVWRDGRPELLHLHLARLCGSIRALYGQASALSAERVLRRGVAELGRVLGERCAVLRLSWSPGAQGHGATALVHSRALPERPAAVRLGVEHGLRVPAGDALEQHKHFNRLAKRRAQAAAEVRGEFDALLLTTDDRVLEATRASVIAVLDGKARTPRLESGCLPGIARGLLVEHGEVSEGDFSLNDLPRAEELILCSTVRGILPVLEVSGLGKTLPGASGMHFSRIFDAWNRLSRAAGA